jgi:hypothetical protein
MAQTRTTITATATRIVMTFHHAIMFHGTERPSDALFVDETRTVYDLKLAHGLWCDMGEPDTITVTIEPGDRLNVPS